MCNLRELYTCTVIRNLKIKLRYIAIFFVPLCDKTKTTIMSDFKAIIFAFRRASDYRIEAPPHRSLAPGQMAVFPKGEAT